MASIKGLTVSRPLSDCSYDRIVDSGYKLTRVQIKSSQTKHSRDNTNGDRYVVKTCGSNRRLYTNDIDTFAIYISPVDCWFIIPAKDIRSGTLTLTLSGNGKKYLNKWDELF